MIDLNIEPLSAGAEVGTTAISLTQQESLPVGAVVQERDTITGYIRCLDGKWLRIDINRVPDPVPAAGSYNTSQFSPGYNSVLSLPEGTTIVPIKDPVEKATVTQYQQEFKEYALSSGRNHSISTTIVEGILERLGITDGDSPVYGEGGSINNSTLASLPVDSLVYTGRVGGPELTIWRVVDHHGGTLRVLGPLASPPTRVNVMHRPDGAKHEPQREGDNSDAEQIAEFKARAWRLGVQAKRRHGWCSTYESVMSGFGIDESCLAAVKFAGFSLGDTVNSADCASLPVGTVLKWTHSDNPTWFCYYIRDDSASNAAKTRRLYGWREDTARLGHYASVMTVVGWKPNHSYHEVTAEEWANKPFPTGTIINSQRNGFGDNYILAVNGLWEPLFNSDDPWPTSRERGSGRLDQLFGRHAFVSRFVGE